jgi:hypothetical protein
MNRLLVTVDSLRLDHYEVMEHTRAFLGPSHQRAFSTATATLGAFPTMMTGRYDAQHSINPSESWVTEIDDPCFGATANRLTAGRYGYDGGFDTFQSPISRGEESLKDRIASYVPTGFPYRVASKLWSAWQQYTPSPTQKSFRPACDLIDDFLQWEREYSDWFAWLHLMEPHHPYDPDGSTLSRAQAQALSREAIASNDPEQPEQVRDLYMTEVRETDQQLSRLWDTIPEETQVIFAADHGELLGEDDVWGHPGQMFHSDIIRIPFCTRNVSVTGDVVSFIDIPALFFQQDWRESSCARDVAFASMNGMKCAFNSTHMITEGKCRTLDGEPASPPSKLKRKFNSFEPSTITKQDAVAEDLQALGYLE